MIHKLSIRNFKSIRELDLDCRRVNVLIGEPNAGKTNILEALGLWCPGVWADLKTICRLDRFIDIVHEHLANQTTLVRLDDNVVSLMLIDKPSRLRLDFNEGESNPFKASYTVKIDEEGKADEYGPAHEPVGINIGTQYFVFNPDLPQEGYETEGLEPPYGANLAAFLATDKQARIMFSSFFEGQRYRPTIDRSRNTVFLAHEEDGTLVTLPFKAASETVRRMLFFHLAIQTSNDAILVFDEPEAHSFPPYTKTLAERIALDDRGNQFFLTTHSPYMLDSLLSKTPASDLNVILCRMENFETKAYPMNQDQIDQIKEWSMDAFFNFDRLLPEVE